jgi:serine/threonine protein kinase
MARKEPYNEDSVDKLKLAIFSKTREKLSENYSQSLRDLVDKCLVTDPDKRPTIEQVLRHQLVRAELTNILNDFVPLTYNYPTAMTAHLVLEQVIEIQCELAKSTDYGLTVSDPSLIRVANTPNTQFLLQAELRAIQSGLQYIEEVDEDGDIYKGYEDKDGKREGVGMWIFTDGQKDIAEYHLSKLHGCGKGELANGNKYWGEYKDGKLEGYGTYEWADGNRYIGQWL